MTIVTVKATPIARPRIPAAYHIRHNRKVTRREAQQWVRARVQPRSNGFFVIIRPTTKQLRDWLNAPMTPRGVKGHLWSMLRYRRQVH